MPKLYEPHERFGKLSDAVNMAHCRADVYDNLTRNFSQCARKKAVERDGVGYCRQHDPEAAEARAAERSARDEAERYRRERSTKRPLEYRDALRAIAEETKKQQLPITSRVYSLATEALAKWGDLGTE